MERETFSSRLGFILISAGCAIGLGNVWRFPYIAGQNGGAAFVLLYLFFLLILGVPILVCEFAVGRASKKSIAQSFSVLEPEGTYWHFHAWTGIIGNYVIMMFYTIITGWMFSYFVKMISGDLSGKTITEIQDVYLNLTGNTLEMIFWTFVTIVLGFSVCSLGLQNGVERVTKWMMIFLLALLGLLAIRSVTLPGASEGLAFYLLPDFHQLRNIGYLQVVTASMGQAFFTLSIGLGSMAVFGSYIEKERRLCGESITIIFLDTIVALVSGLIVFPTCYAFGLDPGEGPGLVFVTLPNIFHSMRGGRVWGSLFFLFMIFAALSSVIGIFQNIIAFSGDKWGWSIKKASLINGILIFFLSIPGIFGKTIWNHIRPLGMEIMDFEDFLVSQNLMPFGAFIYVLFCTTTYGWGWNHFIEEANTGTGIRFPNWMRRYMMFGIPVIILFLTIL